MQRLVVQYIGNKYTLKNLYFEIYIAKSTEVITPIMYVIYQLTRSPLGKLMTSK